MLSERGLLKKIGSRKFTRLLKNSNEWDLQTTDVSYAAGVRQVATFFAVLMGVFLLKEPYGLIRFLASFLIVMGIVLIKIG